MSVPFFTSLHKHISFWHIMSSFCRRVSEKKTLNNRKKMRDSFFAEELAQTIWAFRMNE
jgi:hypothetical protein